MGLQQVLQFRPFHSVRHLVYTIYSSIPKLCSPCVSYIWTSLCSCFRSTLHFCSQQVLLFHPFHSVCHLVYSIYSSIPKLCSPCISYIWTLLCSCFRSTLHFRSPCSISDPQTLTLICARSSLPWYVLFQYKYVPNFMYVPQSEIDIDCPLNSSSEPPNPFPKFEDSRHLVVQHISWSQVLTEHPAPQYALGLISSHNNSPV